MNTTFGSEHMQLSKHRLSSIWVGSLWRGKLKWQGGEMTSAPYQMPGGGLKGLETGEDRPLWLLGKSEAIPWVLEVQQEETLTTGSSQKAKGKWRSREFTKEILRNSKFLQQCLRFKWQDGFLNFFSLLRLDFWAWSFFYLQFIYTLCWSFAKWWIANKI